jgi:hypothetical protein
VYTESGEKRERDGEGKEERVGNIETDRERDRMIKREIVE